MFCMKNWHCIRNMKNKVELGVDGESQVIVNLANNFEYLIGPAELRCKLLGGLPLKRGLFVWLEMKEHHIPHLKDVF